MVGADAGDYSGALEGRAEGTGAALVPVVIRKAVAPRASYREYREDLREDFLFSCAYCTITETEAQGIGFNIDHYLPQEHYPHLLTDYSNLMWSCARCNGNKSDYPEAGREIGDLRVIKADQENPRQHLELAEQSDALKHTTNTGQFNIQLLRLNRPALLKLRAARRKLSKSSAFVAHGVSELLNVGIDVVDKRHRPSFFKFQRALERDYQRTVASVRKLIEAAARSEMLDVEPDRQKDLAARMEYLRSVGAVDSRLFTVPKVRASRRGKKGGRS